MGSVSKTGADGTGGSAGAAAVANNLYLFPGDVDEEAFATGGRGASPASGVTGVTAGAGGAATATTRSNGAYGGTSLVTGATSQGGIGAPTDVFSSPWGR